MLSGSLSQVNEKVAEGLQVVQDAASLLPPVRNELPCPSPFPVAEKHTSIGDFIVADKKMGYGETV
jgi:hypothetical protein